MVVILSLFQFSGEFGLIDVSWRSLAVGVITSILVLPINFLITLIFRRSKVSITCTSVQKYTTLQGSATRWKCVNYSFQCNYNGFIQSWHEQYLCPHEFYRCFNCPFTLGACLPFRLLIVITISFKSAWDIRNNLLCERRRCSTGKWPLGLRISLHWEHVSFNSERRYLRL